MPANILNLSSYVVTTLVENEHDYHLDAEAKEHPSTCQVCGTPDIVAFGRNKQLVRDLPIHGKRVGIYVDTRRYRCSTWLSGSASNRSSDPLLTLLMKLE